MIVKPQPPKVIIARDSIVFPVLLCLLILLGIALNSYLVFAQIPKEFGEGFYPRPDIIIKEESKTTVKKEEPKQVTKEEIKPPVKEEVKPSKPKKLKVPQWFYDADLNEDKELTLKEIIEFFEMYDINNDGYVTKDEVIRMEGELNGS